MSNITPYQGGAVAPYDAYAPPADVTTDRAPSRVQSGMVGAQIDKLAQEDAPIVADIAGYVEKAGVPAQHVAQMVAAYAKWDRDQDASIAADLKREHAANLRALQAEWGRDFARNLETARKAYASLPTALQAVIRNGCDDHGTPGAINKPVVQWLYELGARESRAPTYDRQSSTSSLDAQIREIETLLRTNRAAYDRDPEIQQKYRELLAKRGAR